jgi:anthranilate phosphoribosyltransferase
MNALTGAVERLGAGVSLQSEEMRQLVGSLLDGEATHDLASQFLFALKAKGETADELAGAVNAVRDRMTPWDSGGARESLVDTCGTGGDGACTLNISTAAAIVVAACQVPVVKHGNRSATSKAGSSDVLAALGVAHDAEPDISRRCLAELSLAFLFAPRYHPGLVPLATVRRSLPFRTLFNLIGPLCNPASPPYQLIGSASDAQADLLAQVVSRQDHIRRAVIVTGCDGLDEITLAGPTFVRVIESGRVEEKAWRPDDFGLTSQDAGPLKIRDAAESALKLERLFDGEKGPVRDYVLANCAGALWVTGGFSLREGVLRAASAIDSGAAARLIKRLRELAPVR